MKDFKISESQGLKNTSIEPNPKGLRTNEKTENLFGRAFMDKVFGRTKGMLVRKATVIAERQLWLTE